MTCSYTLSGNDAAHWVKPADTTILIVAQSSFSLSGWPTQVAQSQSTLTLSLAPAHAPFLTGVTIDIACTAGGTPAPVSLFFPASSVTPKTWVYTAGNTPVPRSARSVLCGGWRR